MYLSFKDLNIDYSYDSESNDLLNDFYVPVLSESSEYYRAVGYFDSKSLSYAARGVKNFILNNGKMRIVCGTQLSEEDVESIISAEKTPEEVLTHNFLENLDSLEDNIKKNHVEILGWMIANDLLEIKVALKIDEDGNPTPGKEGLHLKVGILKDKEGNYITINGSNNETAFGWGKNYEIFDVFKGWVSSDFARLNKHINLFQNIWEGNVSSYKIMEVPEAIEELSKRAPSDITKLKFPEDYYKKSQNKITLFEYQIEAINKWFENNKKGIFSMATGTGKTFTALGCLERVLDNEKNLIAIISAPQMHLVQQWKNSVDTYGLTNRFNDIVVVDSSNPKGKTQFKDSVYKVDMGLMDTVLILTTHDSLSSENFYNFFEDDFDVPIMLIGDEMHGLGSYKRKDGLSPQYNYRLGLSATPIRHFDEEGTEFLFNYFEKEVYIFSLEKALSEINPRTDLTYLTPYNYYPHFIDMTDKELKNFRKKTKQILWESRKDNPNEERLENLIIERANIIKNAANKFDALRKILRDMDDKRNLLVYCNENQIIEVVNILGNEFDLDVKTFTSKDDAKPSKKYGGISEREFILKNFEKGNYNALVAMHCLDEGVDVPSATRAILMCNSTNPREFIQRVGRVIRRHDDKVESDIYDMIIKPSNKNSDLFKIEQDIYEKELIRADEIGRLALNNSYYYTKTKNIW